MDFNKPIASNTESDILAEVLGGRQDQARMFDPASVTDPSNKPLYVVRWNNASGQWQRWNGTSWPSLGTLAHDISGNAATATKLQTARTIGITGDITWTSPSFDGSGNVTAAATLANSGVAAGTYGGNNSIPSLTVDAKGRVTGVTTVTPSGTYGISVSGSSSYAASAGNADTVDGHHETSFMRTWAGAYGGIDSDYRAGCGGWDSAVGGGTYPSFAGQYGILAKLVSSGDSHNGSSNWIAQLGFSASTPEKAGYRTKVNAAAWSAWYELYHSGNTPGTLMTEQATTSGTSKDITGIPSGVKKVTVMLNGVSTNGSSNLMLQLGDAGGVESSGYAGAAFSSSAGTVAWSSGAILTSGLSASDTVQAVFRLTRITGNTWMIDGTVGRAGSAAVANAAGSKSLSDTLDRIRLTTVNGTDAFDAGSWNVLYE